jgi:NADH-quinone oxidoreductase subunit F
MEGDPHRVLEGMAIAGYAVGATYGYIYVRGEYYLSMYRLNKAIADAEAKGLLGDNIQGTGFSFHIKVQTGGGSYVCGEETALIESIEGQRGNPRVKPPFPGVVGVWNKPPLSTMESLPWLLFLGFRWYKSKGTADAAGTKIFQVVGQVKNPGIVEANCGMTVRELIDKYGGGVKDGRNFKTCQTGGSSFGFFKDEHLDTPMEYMAMAKAEGAWVPAPCW